MFAVYVLTIVFILEDDVELTIVKGGLVSLIKKDPKSKCYLEQWHASTEPTTCNGHQLYQVAQGVPSMYLHENKLIFYGGTCWAHW